jgi:hypothetical protein
MASVVTFWQLPEEESAFLEYLESTGDIVGVPWSKVPDRALLEPTPLQTLISRDPDSVLLGRRELLGEMPINTFNEDGIMTYAVAASKAPMLIYGRGKWRGEKNWELQIYLAIGQQPPMMGPELSINLKHSLSGAAR